MPGSLMEFVELNTGDIMQFIGLGVGSSIDPTNAGEIEAAVDTALEVGYRYFDIANLYSMEVNVGNVVKRWIDEGKIKREQLFIAARLPFIGMTPKKVNHFLKKSLENLQMDYIDLYSITWPLGLKYVDDDNKFPKDERGEIMLDFDTDLAAMWKEMEKQVKSKLTKAIGVCNFNEAQLQRILDIAEIIPSVNQVEVHLYFQQNKLRKFCHDKNVWVTAYHSLGGRGRENYSKEWNSVFPLLFEDEAVKEMATKYKRTPAQIILRFHIQQGCAAIPRSTNPARIRENFGVTDFNISQPDMKILRALDKGDEGRSNFCFTGSEEHREYPF